MKLFTSRPDFREAWAATSFRIVMAGMGDDTAMLIAELFERGYEPDELVFCDTGSEFPHTYAFIEHLKKWCSDRQWSKVVVLQKTDRDGNPLSVIGNAEKNNSLPSAAFGMKTCSMRFKIETADKYFNNHPLAWSAWGVARKGQPLSKHTGAILRIVGINADEDHRAMAWAPEDKWVQVFPLIDLGIGEKASSAVERVGLYYPDKSSCICCPYLTGRELSVLRVLHPDEFARIKKLEAAYQANKPESERGPRGMLRKDTIDEKIAQYEKTGRAVSNGSCSRCDSQ